MASVPLHSFKPVYYRFEELLTNQQQALSMDTTIKSEQYSWSHASDAPEHYFPYSGQDNVFLAIDPAIMGPTKMHQAQSPLTPVPLVTHSQTQYFEPGWVLADQNTCSEFNSPCESYGSSPPDSSNSSEFGLSPDAIIYPIRYSPSPVSITAGQVLSAAEVAMSQNMPWASDPHSTMLPWKIHSVEAPMLPSQHLASEQEHQHENVESMDVALDYHLGQIEDSTHSPRAHPQPEELELSEPTPESVATQRASAKISSYPARKSVKEDLTDDEAMEEEDEDTIIIDNPSDSDYQAHTKRRKYSRNGGPRSPKSLKHRRKSSSHSVIDRPRIGKRSDSTSSLPPLHKRRPSKGKTRKGPPFQRTIQEVNKADRTFPCTFHHFGCPAEFPNKNEWKRHVACQHLQLGYYRCDLDNCNPDNVSSNSTSNRRQSSQILAKRPKSVDASDDEEIVRIYNDFNRKDLFTQHCRRMHGPSRNPALCSSTNKRGVCQATKEDEAAFEKELENIRARCWHVRRKAPARSNCGFCTQTFDAEYYTNTSSTEQGSEEKAWEERMEHIGRHYEKENVHKQSEDLDEDLIHWGLECGIFHKLEDGRAWLVNAEAPAHDTEQTVTNYDEERAQTRKARRQPSRTVVVQKKSSVKSESLSDEDKDAEAESD